MTKDCIDVEDVRELLNALEDAVNCDPHVTDSESVQLTQALHHVRRILKAIDSKHGTKGERHAMPTWEPLSLLAQDS